MPERPAEVTAEVLGRGSIYTLGTAAPVLAQLAVTPFVARLLTETTGYGQVAVALVVLQVTMIVASLGLPSVITRQALLASGGIPGARSLFRRGAALTAVVIAAAAAATSVATWAVPGRRHRPGCSRSWPPGPSSSSRTPRRCCGPRTGPGPSSCCRRSPRSVARCSGWSCCSVSTEPRVVPRRSGRRISPGRRARRAPVPRPGTHRPGDLGAAPADGPAGSPASRCPLPRHRRARRPGHGALRVRHSRAAPARHPRRGRPDGARRRAQQLVGARGLPAPGGPARRRRRAHRRRPHRPGGTGRRRCHRAGAVAAPAARRRPVLPPTSSWVPSPSSRSARSSPSGTSPMSISSSPRAAPLGSPWPPRRRSPWDCSSPPLAGSARSPGRHWGYPRCMPPWPSSWRDCAGARVGPGWREARLLPGLLGGVVLVGLLARCPRPAPAQRRAGRGGRHRRRRGAAAASAAAPRVAARPA